MVVVSCGDPASGPGKSAVFLVASGGEVYGLVSDVYNVSAAGRADDDYIELTLKSYSKDPSGNTTLSVYSNVIITMQRVTYTRYDGNPTVPAPFMRDLHVSVPFGGETKINTLVVRREAKQQSPLKELAFGGGEGVIHLTAHIEFYGEDLAGNTVKAEYQLPVRAYDAK